MDVDHRASDAIEEVVREHLHVAGQHDEVEATVSEQLELA